MTSVLQCIEVLQVGCVVGTQCTVDCLTTSYELRCQRDTPEKDAKAKTKKGFISCCLSDTQFPLLSCESSTDLHQPLLHIAHNC